MKTKPACERVPFRCGPLEETTLQALTALRSPQVPALTSENLWLRFSVRVLAELVQLSGAGSLTFQLGTPGAASTTLRVLGAPPMELSAGTSEARLRPGETQLLDQMRRTLGHASRSATLRHALFACRQVCEGVAHGDRIWVERNGNAHVLPSLLEVAANMEQGSGRPVVLLGSDLSARAVSPRFETREPLAATEMAVLCGVTGLNRADRARLCGSADLQSWTSDAVLDHMGARTLCIQVEPDSQNEHIIASPIRIVMQHGREPFIELVPPALPSPSEIEHNVRSIGHIAPRPPGKNNGLHELEHLYGPGRSKGVSSAGKSRTSWQTKRVNER